jgi:hypothetical protein
MEYGIADGKTLTRFVGADTLEKLGSRYLKRKVKEEGYAFNKKGMKDYLESWCEMSHEWDEPVSEPDYIIDYVTDILVCSNIHFINCDKMSQISNNDRNIVSNEIYRLLKTAI